jgi:hypothetical protein
LVALEDSVINGLLYAFVVTVGSTRSNLFANGGKFEDSSVTGSRKEGIKPHVIKITLYLGIEVLLIHKGRTQLL